MPTVAKVRRRLGREREERLLAFETEQHLRVPTNDQFGRMGEGSVIVPPARVTCPDRIFIGERVSVHEWSWLSVVRAIDGIEPTLTIGDRTSIGRFAHIACVGEIDIGPEVLTSERVFIGDTYHGYEDPATPVLHQSMANPEKVTIGRGAFLGIGAIVLMGTTVGEHAYVAAGAVVTSDVPARTLVVGNPARAIKRYDDAKGAWVDLSTT